MSQMIPSRKGSLSWPQPGVMLAGVVASIVAIGGLVTQDHFVASLLAASAVAVALGTVWRNVGAPSLLTRAADRPGRRWLRASSALSGEPSHIHIPRPRRGEEP
jgi:hypothetical protein